MKFRLEKDFLEIFPSARVGVLICRGIDNRVEDEEKYLNEYGPYLRESEKLGLKHVENPEFIENPTIKKWRGAFYKFKTKKGARCSVEALLKRISKGGQIGNINPLVDIYNGISMKYGVPVGGEDIDKFIGDVRLAVADGSEDFVTLGSEKSEPPYPGEVVYKDDAGAICRCFNWREAVRTMITDDTKNTFMCIESDSDDDIDVIQAALDELAALIESKLGGKCEKFIVSAESPEIVICE